MEKKAALPREKSMNEDSAGPITAASCINRRVKRAIHVKVLRAGTVWHWLHVMGVRGVPVALSVCCVPLSNSCGCSKTSDTETGIHELIHHPQINAHTVHLRLIRL